jgi:transcriptional regulator of acetoin/glycerol metabolism
MVALDESRTIVGATFAARRLPGLGDLEKHGVRFDLGSAAELTPGFEEAERGVVQGALAMCQGRVTAAADLLGVSRSTLHRKIKAMGGRNNLARMTARSALQAQGQRVSTAQS